MNRLPRISVLRRACGARGRHPFVRSYSFFGSHFFNRSGSDDPPVEVNPYIRYPIITKDQMKTIANDKFKFEYGYASYGHHTSNSDPTIHSLSDLTDPTQLKSLLPQRRPEGSPIDTLSVKAGDDAMLVSPTVLAVADGVSGWELKHENSSSGVWSRSMLETLSRLMTEYKVSHSPHHLHKRDIDQILDDSYLHTSHQMDLQQLGGSSTLILCMLSGIYLQIISIGDSKLYLIRDGDIIKTNDEQMISPLCPQQIGTHTLSHMPSEIAWVDSIELQKDDIIVVCSDGISDNLYPHEILEFVNHNLNSKKNNLKAVARIILSKAKTVGFDDYAYTPYNEKVNNLPNSMRNDTVSAGGKLDDMSVCIAKVIPNGNI